MEDLKIGRKIRTKVCPARLSVRMLVIGNFLLENGSGSWDCAAMRRFFEEADFVGWDEMNGRREGYL
ncbi:hypothetical protein TWF730_001028 [Orbilia blumenaviensis]|uniref:Uncharacterized protein n=1 Tax=Orbilia blumenaviensis TaxID=1796055 RepID=A0AAV9VNF2_9PEZI